VKVARRLSCLFRLKCLISAYAFGLNITKAAHQGLGDAQMKDDLRHRFVTAREPLLLDTEKLVELADPLTSIALNLEACVRFLDRQSPDIADAKERLREAIKQCARAQDIYHLI
jgi:predicted  nucleic acid-binding Zn-ribbon protein